MDFDYCENLFNTTNASQRDAQAGLENVTRAQYVRMCVNFRRAHDSDVSNIIILPYGLIFLLSVVGNTLVILTLVRHKKMRTITNMYLINLALSDLLLAVFCMPFTLVPMLMQEFIFGPVLCVLIRYAQAVSVGVSCGTLVAISLERFYAICQPLRSRRWQTLSHSYRVILAIWLGSVSLMVPVAVFNRDIQLKNGKHACREIWPSYLWESLYMVLLDMVLLVIPLFLMAFSYGHVAKELWSGVTISTTDPGSPLSETESTRFEVKDSLCPPPTGTTTTNSLSISMSSLVTRHQQNGHSTPRQAGQSPLLDRRQNNIKRSVSAESSVTLSTANNGSSSHSNNSKHHHLLHHHLHNSSTGSNSQAAQSLMHPAYTARVLKNKRRVVKMLCVVVLEYFICWTPLYLLYSWTVLDYLSARVHFTPLLKSALLLLAYLSSCIHPITYCFMNRRFRQSFADAFRCCFRHRLGAHTVLYSEASHALPAAGGGGAGGASAKGQGLNGRAGVVGTNNRNFRITWKKT